MVRRNSMDAFTNVPSNGKYAMNFQKSGDRLIGVKLLNESQEVFLLMIMRRPSVFRQKTQKLKVGPG